MRAAGSAALGAVLAVAAVAGAAPADAGFTGAATATAAVATATLARPASVTALPDCRGHKVRAVTLSWPATVSAYATSYRVERSVGGSAYQVVASVAGRTTTSYVDAAIPANTTVAYAVRAAYANWTSTAITTATFQTDC